MYQNHRIGEFDHHHRLHIATKRTTWNSLLLIQYCSPCSGYFKILRIPRACRNTIISSVWSFCGSFGNNIRPVVGWLNSPMLLLCCVLGTSHIYPCYQDRYQEIYRSSTCLAFIPYIVYSKALLCTLTVPLPMPQDCYQYKQAQCILGFHSGKIFYSTNAVYPDCPLSSPAIKT